MARVGPQRHTHTKSIITVYNKCKNIHLKKSFGVLKLGRLVGS